MAVNYTSEDILIQSGTTVVAHIDRSYTLHRETIKAKLQAARSQIHFSIDIWSAPHRKAFFGICGQWVDENYQLRKALLGLPNIQYSHKGKIQARHLIETICAFQIMYNIGFIAGDNASSNDTCLQALSQMLEAKHGVKFNPVQRRIRCGGHIINLCLEAFLFASSTEALKAAITEAQDNEDISVVESLQAQLKQKQQIAKSKGKQRKPQDDSSGWRSIGTMGKLHNIAVYIRSSTNITDEWEALAGKMLGIDNATRWNSWYNLLRIALEKQDKLMVFLNTHHKALEDDLLTPEDWELLKITMEFLQPFWYATQVQQRNWSSLDQVLYNMDILLKHLEDSKVCYLSLK